MIKLSDFTLTRSLDIHGIQCHEWHDYYTMVRWEVEYLDSGALRVVESSTGRAAVVGATLVSLCYVKGAERILEAPPVVPDWDGAETHLLTAEETQNALPPVSSEPQQLVEPITEKPKRGPKRKFEK